MSWQASQVFQDATGAGGRMHGGQRPLPQLTAAALLASQKGAAEQALAHLQQALQTQLAAIPDDIRWPAFQAGVAKYAASTVPHDRPTYPVLGTAGRVTLLDAGGEGKPVVLIPSMVNRGYVLDLLPGFSLVEFLKTHGHRVLLIDWGDPASHPDVPLTLETVITGRLEPLLQQAAQQRGPLALVGYCMGGLLAVAAAQRLGPSVVNKLAVAAMPWDFSQTASAAHMQATESWLGPWLASQPTLPPALLAQYFWSLDPWGPIRRIMAYGTETDPARLQHLTLLEDWLADGLALDSPIAKEMLLGWYAHNTAFKGQWQVGDTIIRPAELKMPLWVALTQNDVLVPLNASLPFVGQTQGATVHMAQTGHVGLVCGRRAQAQFYEPLGRWLASPGSK